MSLPGWEIRPADRWEGYRKIVKKITRRDALKSLLGTAALGLADIRLSNSQHL